MIIGASGLGYKYAEILLHNSAKSAVIDAIVNIAFIVALMPMYCASKLAVLRVTTLATDINNKIYDPYYDRTIDNVALAILDFIRKDKNGAVCVNKNGQPPFAVNFIQNDLCLYKLIFDNLCCFDQFT
ncbi:hypothetical protein ALC53_02785 [Atta colombica]|uniref:Uncharacterized protein n=1 Tax=Atta colombica TaxID=520822 RepID=A0A195BQ87_9HYME|nr:hypothetical protein ALC53_02785 [Atta colombica]